MYTYAPAHRSYYTHRSYYKGSKFSDKPRDYRIDLRISMPYF